MIVDLAQDLYHLNHFSHSIYCQQSSRERRCPPRVPRIERGHPRRRHARISTPASGRAANAAAPFNRVRQTPKHTTRSNASIHSTGQWCLNAFASRQPGRRSFCNIWDMSSDRLPFVPTTRDLFIQQFRTESKPFVKLTQEVSLAFRYLLCSRAHEQLRTNEDNYHSCTACYENHRIRRQCSKYHQICSTHTDNTSTPARSY